ncbi:MAG: NAD synthetase [Lysinibacillus sp.]
MRTSRVSATANSTFRNERQYLHANDIGHNFEQGQQRQSFKKNVKQSKEQQTKKGSHTSPQRKLSDLAEAHFDSGCELTDQRELNETAMKLSRLNNQKKLLQSYRSSI